MSSYYQWTKHPTTGKWENAFWIDDYHERHHYGVKFENGEVFDPWETPLRRDINEEEARILNEHKKC